MWYRLNRLVLGTLLRNIVDVRVEGREHEPPPPYLLIANHASAIDDPLVALAVRARLYFIAKEELADNWFVRLWIRSLGNFFVRRHEVDRGAMRRSEEILRSGRALCVFPEGTRSLDGRLGQMWTGAAYLALRTGVPVLPVGLWGNYRAMPRGAPWVRRDAQGRRYAVRVRVGPAIPVARAVGRITHAMKEELTARFRQALIDLLPPEQHPLPEPPRDPEASLASRAGRTSGG